jgi:phosphotransferase system HPr (HPr) family protein
LRIHSSQGLHARPAALFVQLVGRFKASVRVRKGRREVDGKSMMGLLTLAAGRGETIEVTAEGPDAPQVLHALEELISNKEVPAVVRVVRHQPSS